MPNWIQDRLPVWLQGPVAWMLEPAVLSFLAIASLVLFVLSAAGIPWFVARVPTDYFSRRELEQMHIARAPRSSWRIVGGVLKNLLGLTLVVAGIAMIFLPGQGLLTIFVGLLLLEFPGKRWLERRLIAWGPIYRAINRLRRRAGRPPLERGSWG